MDAVKQKEDIVDDEEEGEEEQEEEFSPEKATDKLI
jgi:hypothetical protein